MQLRLHQRLYSRDLSATPPARPAHPAERPIVIAASILVLMASTVALVLAAWLIGWYRVEMLVVAGFTGAAAGALGVLLLYRQIRQWQTATRELQSVTARVGDIVESARDAIITIDATQRVALFNAAAETVFGWPSEAVIGQPLDKLLPPRFRDQHRGHIELFGRTGATARRMGGQTVLTGLRANGEEFPIEASISQHGESGQQIFTVILRDVSERVRVEEALRQSKEELRELGAAAHAAREEEKARIARELHDELAQSLTAMQMDVAWCKQKIPEAESATVARLGKVEALLEESVAATRRIAADLRPLMLDDLGLVPAVEWLTENFAERTRIPCELVVDGTELELPGAQSTAVFRIVQESLANVRKHARASRVRVAIEYTGSELALSIRDDGAGFSPQAPRTPNSFGLLGLRERASLLGGEITITSAPGRGTQVEVRLPLAPPTLSS